MRKTLLSIIILLSVSNLYAQKQYRREVRPSKNVILMIPDGTSPAVMSAARWYKDYNQLGKNLAIDPYICGTVQTFSSNAPIGDSAPTTSCYMTGVPQQAGNIAIYPLQDKENDLVPINPTNSYQPLATILEACKYQLNKSTGIVATVRFAHATPADCASHYYNRGAYDVLSSQMAYNDIDVVIASGNKYITDDIKEHFIKTNTTLVQDNLKDFRAFDGANNFWALFDEKDMPYHIDRDTLAIPSLREMTLKAINQLDKNENGFFLMVEGSKVDWAAHANDAAGVITEYIAFDDAVEAALDFAKEDGETTVIVLSDHGTGGFTIGRRDLSDYTRASIHTLFGNVSKYKRTAEGLAAILEKTDSIAIKSTFEKYSSLSLSDDELKNIRASLGYKEADYMQIANTNNPIAACAKILTDHTYFGFTTGGHTGEEVLLAVYHPLEDLPVGMNTNMEINRYLFDVSGLKTPLSDMNEDIFAKHTDVFKGLNYKIEKPKEGYPELIVIKGKNTLKIPANKSVAYLNDKEINIKSLSIYIDKNETFYVSRDLIDQLK